MEIINKHQALNVMANFKIENLLIENDKIKDVSSWIEATLLNNWSHYNVTNFNSCSYRKIGNQVFLKGMVKSSTTLTTTTRYIFQLPYGYRPKKSTYVVGNYNGNPVNVIIYNNGQVFPDNTSTYQANGFVTLDGISFFID